MYKNINPYHRMSERAHRSRLFIHREADRLLGLYIPSCHCLFVRSLYYQDTNAIHKQLDLLRRTIEALVAPGGVVPTE